MPCVTVAQGYCTAVHCIRERYREAQKLTGSEREAQEHDRLDPRNHVHTTDTPRAATEGRVCEGLFVPNGAIRVFQYVY
jgi:hypothetical protein